MTLVILSTTAAMIKSSIFLGILVVITIFAVGLLGISIFQQKRYDSDELPAIEGLDDEDTMDLLAPAEEIDELSEEDRPAFMLESDYSVPEEYNDVFDPEVDKIIVEFNDLLEPKKGLFKRVFSRN